MSDKKIQWHPGFAAAMDLELSANRSKGFIDIIKSETIVGVLLIRKGIRDGVKRHRYRDCVSK